MVHGIPGHSSMGMRTRHSPPIGGLFIETSKTGTKFTWLQGEERGGERKEREKDKKRYKRYRYLSIKRVGKYTTITHKLSPSPLA